MTTKLRERVHQDASAPQAPHDQRHRGGPMAWGVAAIFAVVLGGAIGVMVFSTGDAGPPETAAQALTDDERICQLATQGRLPLEACSTAASGQQLSPQLYTSTELEMIRLVEAGRLPPETLNGQTFLSKRLANQGEIPREAAYGLTTP